MRKLLMIVVAMVPGVALAAQAPGDADVGMHVLATGHAQAAEPLLRRAVMRTPADQIARFNLASAWRDMGRYDEAIGEYQIAVQLARPRDPKTASDSLYGIALANEAKGDAVATMHAWDDYLTYARRFTPGDPAIRIAEQEFDNACQLAGLKAAPGVKKANR